ncbi:iron-sulfur cluster repair di-iron protein [Algoriphagus sp. H41]|uniref:Iron-sulfur cluster repair di-iron protein n=1 Tax=Algoriphagus oliviformis TaxID=2811231 RepID=A0ABS3C8V5_9BACT|nr:iron-sulfur cluster repair di-iron protein [Algoriphagus oliviformis]MBN7813548.1 iron-sulfur cluster repair di-iron protein [Algoriphagus oliviformis]
MESIAKFPIREIISKDYRSALVFRAFGIDFCCIGDLTLQEACVRKNLDQKDLVEKLEEAFALPDEEINDFHSWPLNRLSNYIETKYHGLIRERVPVIQKFLKQIVKVHGTFEPNLKKVKSLFDQSTSELLDHMQREELIIFPFIRKIVAGGKSKDLLLGPSFQNVKETIFSLMKEHDQEGEYLEEIRSLTNNYSPPDYACNTYKVAFALLKEFEISMHQHIHLERDILFPGAIQLENQSSIIRN